MGLDKIIKSRRSVRKFNSKKPDWRSILEAIDLTRYAPMAGGNFTLRFIVVSDLEKIKKITKACQQDFVGKAQYLVVVCSDPSRTVNSYGKKGESYVKQQAGSAIQNFLLKIEELGLSTCWIGYFVDEQIKKILKIPEKIEIEALFPIGFDYDKRRTRKMRIDFDEILYFDEWKQIRMKKLKKMDV
ncbi:nitroreductase family protein [Patescibacteria group bacterium]|nr:nitroreductase family protein [Patescibacteria group bacterium]